MGIFVNCVELFLSHARANPRKMALWLPRSGATTFGELELHARRAQKLCRAYGVGPGESVLLLDSLNPRLYGCLIGILGMGASVVLVEPWMPVAKINHVIKEVKPKLFLSIWLGKLWGLRVPAIRAIPKWAPINELHHQTAEGSLHLESVQENTPGIITFTSGTTGNPKGIVRNQGYLVHQHEVISATLKGDLLSSPDLCIFANFALLNLASGRGTIIVPPAWKPSVLKQLGGLPTDLRPVSLTCGPAFLMKLMEETQLSSLKHIHVGGALTDCWIFEKAFGRWPEAHFAHLYGSSEAEPVAVSDARHAVHLSRSRGYFQTLHLGKPISFIESELEKDGAWVTGPHVCPQYLANAEENKLYKRKDTQGRIWHFMGDRVVEDGEGWWYGGRSGQKTEDFILEQKIYSLLKSSLSFVQRDRAGKIYVLGEKIKEHTENIRRQFSEVEDVVELKIFRDRRHRARIDRAACLKKGASWLLG